MLVSGADAVAALTFAVQCGEFRLAEAKIEGRNFQQFVVGNKRQ